MPERLAGALQKFVRLLAGVGFPTVQDFAQGMPGQRPDDGVNVIGHDDPRAQLIALADEKFQGTGNEVSHVNPAQPARAFAAIEQRFNLVAIPGDQALFLVPGQRALGGAGLFDDDTAFVFEPGNFVSGQGIVEPEGDKINRVLFFQMRQLAAKMQPGHQRIRRLGKCRRLVGIRHVDTMLTMTATGKHGLRDVASGILA